MVFEVGNRVTGSGWLVADADRESLDLARFHDLVRRLGPAPRSTRSVRLIRADFDAVGTQVWPDNTVLLPATRKPD
jgi:hypothetical protein